jgi:GTP cyclohydrolase IA
MTSPMPDGIFDSPTSADLAEVGVRDLMRHLGYDPDHETVIDTPGRVVRAYEELTAGQHLDPTRHLKRTFPAEGTDHDEMIAVVGIDFVAVCEHHLLPFPGMATVAYKPSPGAPVVGLSKLARVVDEYARRLTMQERITRQVTDALDHHLDTTGSACILSSTHACMGLRGVRKPGARMVTSSLTGVFRDHPETRAELLAIAHTPTP